MWVEGASLYHCRRLSSVFGQFDRTFEWKLLNLADSSAEQPIECCWGMSSSSIGVGRSAWGCKRKNCCILSRDNVSATPSPAICSILMDMSKCATKNHKVHSKCITKGSWALFNSSYYSSVVTFEQNGPARQERAPNSAIYNNRNQLFCHDCLLEPFWGPLQLEPFTAEEASTSPRSQCISLDGKVGCTRWRKLTPFHSLRNMCHQYASDRNSLFRQVK